MEILELSGKCNGTMLNCSLASLQFQGLGKCEAIHVFMTQNVFGINSRKKNWLIVSLLFFYRVSVMMLRWLLWLLK